MLFSIIVPVYKVEQYLEKCVDSIMSQTFNDLEIILVDDGSPDNCPRMCDEFATKDNRVKVVHKKNGGLSDARNAGLRVARGEYIFFVDSDDYIESDACEKLSRYVDLKADILIGDAVIRGNASGVIDHSKKMLGEVYSGTDFLKIGYCSNKMPMAAWLNVYRREFLIENSLEFKFGILHEDEQFTPRVFLKADRVVYTGVAFYNYFIRENSITTKKDKRKNAIDLYSTCIELESIFSSIEDRKLRNGAFDALVVKYLNIFQVAELYKYGKEYIHKKFVIKNARKIKTRFKALLFCVSPIIYFKANSFVKRIASQR